MKFKKDEKMMDQLLKRVLVTQQKPDEILHQRVLHQWKENQVMKRKTKQYKIAVAAAACVLMISAGSVAAAVHFHSAGEVASELGYESLSELFESDCAISVNQTQEGGEYVYTVLGMAQGEDLLRTNLEKADIEGEHFYAVIAISRKDGTSLTLDEFDGEQKYFISPLIQGLNPFQYNMTTMDGRYSETEMDGVVYRLIDCDAVSYFADRTIYLCVLNTGLYEPDAYYFDEESGVISRNENYNGVNLLFELPIDKNYAAPQKGAEYLQELQEDWEESDDFSDSEAEDNTSENLSGEQEWITTVKTERDSALHEAMETAPENIEDAVADMKLVDEQTAKMVEGRFTFLKKRTGESAYERWYEPADFTNNVTYSWGMAYGADDRYCEEVEIVQLNEDGTATWKLYQKIYT